MKRFATVYPHNNCTDNSTSLTGGSLLKTINGTTSMASPPAKRRRSESSNHQQLPVPQSEIGALTLDQLKVQYGNVSVSILIISSIFNQFFS